MPNTTMTPENVASMVNGFAGDYFGFQAYFEGLPVSYIPYGRLPSSTLTFSLSTRDPTAVLI